VSINQKDGSSKKVGSRTDGDSFGEMALLYNAGRTATITATRDCDLWAVRPPP
jgi:CRP-like cAMP-binding protein